MSFWSDLSKATTPNWWDSSWDSVQTGYDGESQTGIWGPGTDLFTPFHATPDNGEEAGAPENTAVIDKYKALPKIGISNIQATNPNTNMHTAQLADGRTVHITPLANAGSPGGWRPSNRGQPGSTTFESISNQRDIDLIRGDAISADGKYIISTTAPTRTAPPVNSDYGFMDFLGEVAPSALIPFAGPLAGALGSAGLSAGAAAAGTGAILGGGGAALTGGDIGRGALLGGATAAIGNGIFNGSTPGDVIPEFDYAAGGSNGMYNPPAVSYPVNALAPPQSFDLPATPTDVTSFNPNSTVGDPLYGGQGGGVGASVGGGEGQFVRPMEDPYANGRIRIDNETSIDGGGTFNSGPATFDPNSINADIYNTPPPSGPATFNPNSTVGDPFLGETSVLGGGGTPAAITPGLIQQLANYTGLSTGAIAGLGGAAISSLAGLYGAGMVGSAADRAAKGIADANASSNALLAAIDARNKAREEPFYQAGVNALPAYTKGVMPGGDLVRPFSMADYQADPGYGFRLSEGMKAMDRSAASRGRLMSGETIKGAQRYGQDLASQEYQNAYNRYGSDQATRRNALASLTGFAPTASSAIRSSDMAYGGNAANLASNTANAMAGAGATRASSYGNALAGIGQNAYNALNPNPFAQYMQRQLGP